jgi:exosortase/archaeosortase
MLVPALVAVGVFAGFRTHVFLCAEVVAIALVLGLCTSVDVTRRRRGGAQRAHLPVITVSSSL